MTTAITPFLMFAGEANAAIELYLSVFEDSSVELLTRFGPEAGDLAGNVSQAQLTLAGQPVRIIDSPVEHAFGFTPAVSLFVDCDSLEQIESFAAKLGEGGLVLMELGTYPFAQRFTWFNDRYGVSWQLSLK